MDGKRLVVGLLALTVVTAALFWAVALDVWWGIEAREQARGTPVLSRQEAAARVAKEDMFGLPSRLEAPPPRDLTRPWRDGTTSNPFPADEGGVDDLFEVYAVTVKGCRGLLPTEVREAPFLPVYVTLRTVDGHGRVVAVDGLGEGHTTRSFVDCVAGGVTGAVFVAPEGGQITVGHKLRLP